MCKKIAKQPLLKLKSEYKQFIDHEADPDTVYAPPAWGPVGLLMLDLRQCGYELDDVLSSPAQVNHQLMGHSLAAPQEGYH